MAAADSGDVHDCAEMKIFLDKALMKKLSENGGRHSL
jgi:hypothetical protein